MDESKLTFLTEVELPPYCFVSEAVEWIAFGRVPQMQHHEEHKTHELVDYRFYWREMPDNFQPSFDYPWFDRLEFESLGISAPDGYFEAAEKCVGEGVRELPADISQYEEQAEIFFKKEDGSTVEIYREMAADARRKLTELAPMQRLVDQTEASFRPYFEIACAKLFPLLAVGELTSQAVDFERWDRLSEEGDYEDAGRFDDVPPSAFSLNMDWQSNEISISGRRNVALRLNTQDILDRKAILLQSGKSISVERFGAFYFSSNTGQTNRKKKRGRQSVVDWSILKMHLVELTKAGSHPDSKENCIYEIIAFAEQTLGKSPSRTAVQRNMGAELSALYARI